jgi:hypothetical protein
VEPAAVQLQFTNSPNTPPPAAALPTIMVEHDVTDLYANSSATRTTETRQQFDVGTFERDA